MPFMYVQVDRFALLFHSKVIRYVTPTLTLVLAMPRCAGRRTDKLALILVDGIDGVNAKKDTTPATD